MALVTLAALAWLATGVLMPRGLEWYTGVRNAPLTYDTVRRLTPAEFEALARDLGRTAHRSRIMARVAGEGDPLLRQEKARLLMFTASARPDTAYPHIDYFRRAGIREYAGPETCLECHATMKVTRPDGAIVEVDTMRDVMDTSHFKFQQTASRFSTIGFDGREVNGPGTRPVPVGKIDRACGIPGSFSWTGWASLVAAKPEHARGKVEVRSEGCGQCHIGGSYHPATEKMLPGFKIPRVTQHGLDCLICHSDTYDMNYRTVIRDAVGTRWNQDRTMRAALTVGRPTAEACLRCHQHNHGGDTYPHNDAARALGYKNPRILHTGAKRASGFAPHDDVHAAAGMACLDCHAPQGHKIPRGKLGTDLVSNDLPDVEVSCEKCHTTAPHVKDPSTRVILNGHVARLACETCHIKELEPTSVVLRDWVHPTYNPEEGIYTPTDIYRNGQPGKGMSYLWFNGWGTFLANGLGDNPSGGEGYNPLMANITRLDNPAVKAEILAANGEFFRANRLDPETYLKPAFDALSQMSDDLRRRRAQMIESGLRPVMRSRPSRIYPFKLFNALMCEDLGNEGPFGAMILPFDYPTYYQTGDAYKAMEVAVRNPIVKRMYQAPFKYYMMDEFMKYFGVGSWSTAYPLEEQNRKNIQPRWMRQMGTLMVNHGIQAKGFECVDCHSPNGIMDFKALGYTPERVKDLEHLPELRFFAKEGGSARPGS
ncbi:MAG: nitrite reductase [Armatimonadetes bacterium]|nr:nitrite reductase [Armatimonadota bacterium]